MLENRTGAEPFFLKVASETFAQAFEELIVGDFLRGSRHSGLTQWRNYQRRVDALNFHLFFAEASEILELTNRPELFSESSYVFRESLMIAPGYQSVYALASLYRCEKSLYAQEQ